MSRSKIPATGDHASPWILSRRQNYVAAGHRPALRSLTKWQCTFPKGRGRNYSSVFFRHEMVNAFRDWIKFSFSWEGEGRDEVERFFLLHRSGQDSVDHLSDFAFQAGIFFAINPRENMKARRLNKFCE